MKKSALFMFMFFSSFLCPDLLKGNSFLRANTIEPPVDNKEAAKLISTRPVRFIENKGQMTDMDHHPVPFVFFKIPAPGMDVYITEKGLTYVFIKPEKFAERLAAGDKTNINWERIEMNLEGARINSENIIAEGKSVNFSNYFLGQNNNRISDVHDFQKITIKNIYPGIDWILYNSNQEGFKYDFVVHPGADYKKIEISYSSLSPLQLEANGNIILSTKIGTLNENAPVSFLNGKKLKSEFIKRAQQQDKFGGTKTDIRFSIPEITSLGFSTDLVIDPQLNWSTFIGGSSIEGALSVVTDSSDNVLITGYTLSSDYPTLDEGSYFQGTHGGGFYDAFILKFDNAGILLWATYYGGDGSDTGNSITVDTGGNIFLAGITSSDNLPVADASTFFQGTIAGAADVFISKFDNLGNLIWATYYGGSESEGAYSIAADAIGNIFVTGYTLSPDFPVLDAGTFFQGIFAGATPPAGDAFILKFDNSGTRQWATFYGGTEDESGYSIATDPSNNVYVTGRTASLDFPLLNAGTFFQGTYGGGINDGFILKFDNGGNRLWGSYFGGALEDQGRSVLSDAVGNIFITGNTRSADFPVLDAGTFFQGTNAGNNDVFISKFNNAGTLSWSTYYGGTGYELSQPYDNLAFDSCGNLFVSFQTDFSASIHTQTACDNGYNDSTYNGDFSDIFVTMFSNYGVLRWATYLGGDGAEDWSPMAVDKKNNLYVAGGLGISDATSFPLADPGSGAYYDASFNGSKDAFITKFSPAPITTTVTNAGCTCAGTALALMPGTCYHNYLWSDGQTTQTAVGLCPGNYNVIVTDTVMCNTQTAVVTIESSDIAVSVNAATICAGDTTSLAAAGATTYTWSAGAVPSDSASADVFPPITTTYTVIGTTGTCVDTAVTTVTVNSVPDVTVNSPALCAGDNTLLTANGAISYTWSTTETTASINVSPSVTTSYTVTGNSEGCIDTAVALVTVNPIPTAGVSSDTTIIIGSTIPLIATGGTGFSWNPTAGLSCGDCPTPLASPLTTTTYCVTVSDGNCTDDACVVVRVEMPCAGITEFNVPDAFSPNNDGNNDHFLLQGWSECMKDFSISIYNRWGEKIFESDDVSFAWDGTFRNKVLDPAVFVYHIKARLFNDALVERKGNITLIR